MKIKFTLLLIPIIAGSYTSYAQFGKLQAMEEELVFIQDTAKETWFKIKKSNYKDDSLLIFSNYSDMLDLLCRQFDMMLNVMLVEDKDMTYPFTKLQMQKGGLLDTYIAWSNDSLLRVFSWFLPGGTMHFYGNIIQYKDANSTVRSFSFINEYNSDYGVNSTGFNYDNVFTLKEKGKTFYILSGRTMAQTMYPVYQLAAYSIGDKLTMENIFEDENGNITNEIINAYDIGCSTIDGNNFPHPVIDEKSKTMNLLEINDACFTGKFIKYNFDGKKFKFN